jgi:hypothetical protein
VAGAIESEAMVAALEAAGISDPVDTAFLLSALDVLKEWGVAAPNLTERLARENGEPEKASDKQRALIADLCRRKQRLAARPRWTVQAESLRADRLPQ